MNGLSLHILERTHRLPSNLTTIYFVPKLVSGKLPRLALIMSEYPSHTGLSRMSIPPTRMSRRSAGGIYCEQLNIVENSDSGSIFACTPPLAVRTDLITGLLFIFHNAYIQRPTGNYWMVKWVPPFCYEA